MGYSLRMAASMLVLAASGGLATAQQPGPMTGTSSTATTSTELQLTPQQRTEIYDSVSKLKVSRTPPPANLHVALGGDLPASMELYDLPPNIAADIPATKLYKYTLVQSQVVIVDPTKMKVVDIIRQ
jgi:Flp pilus assembly protein TadD